MPDNAPRLAYLIGRLDRIVRNGIADELASVDLSVAQYTAMSVLARRPGLSNAQLARRSLVSPQAMNQALVGLVDRGLIERPDEPKGRVLSIYLTDEGAALLERLRPRIDAVEDTLLANLTAHQRTELLEMLESIAGFTTRTTSH